MAKFKDKKSEERIFKIFGFMQPYAHTLFIAYFPHFELTL